MIGQWRWALLEDDELTPTEQHIALALAVRMNHDGTIPRQYAPGSRRIAADTGRKKVTVLEVLRSLAERGWLEQVEEASGPRPAQYRATFPSGCSRGTANGSPSVPTSPELVGPLQAVVGPLQEHSGSSSGTTTSTTSAASTSDGGSHEPGEDQPHPADDPKAQKALETAKASLAEKWTAP